MDFISCLFCISLYGGLGVQSGFETEGLRYSEPVEKNGNSYSYGVGEAGLVFNYGLAYTELKHLSGIGSEELDGGLNAAMTGVQLSRGDLVVRASVGPQLQSSEYKTNTYGDFLYEASIMYKLDGLFVKATKLSGMEYITAGWIKEW